MNMQNKHETMLASLRDVAQRIVEDIRVGQKSDARLRFQSIIGVRRPYVAWCITCIYPESIDKIDDLERFFLSVTE